MRKAASFLIHFINVLTVAALGLMCFLVFGNVILRYVLNSGILWSEELSRYLFMWLIFLGSIVAMKDNEHLGMDTIVKRLPQGAKKVAFIASNLLQLYLLYLVFEGTWKMTVKNFNTYSPALGLPYAYYYGVGLVVSVGMGIVLLINTCRVLVDQQSVNLLTLKKESEEELREPGVVN